MVDSAALHNHRLIGPGLSLAKLARYLRHFVPRHGVIVIYRVNPAPESGEPAVTVINLDSETSASVCLMALAKLPNGGVPGRIVSDPPPATPSRQRPRQRHDAALPPVVSAIG